MRSAIAFAVFAIGCGTAQPEDDLPSCAGASCVKIHETGIIDPNSPNFHGKLIQSLNWNFTSCQSCHGSDFSGGISGQSCLTCHTKGPTSCTTCHDLPPSTGSHTAHTRFDCSECHVTPTAYTDVGHLFNADGGVITAARVTFGALASTNGATPAWDGAKCDNVYCHGSTFGDTNAKQTTPTWYGGSATCGSCHGLPPSDHANSQCISCHPRVVDSNQQIVNTSLHVDGKVSLGDDSGTCLACHPSPGGAHLGHTSATHRLRPPLGCVECHAVPTTVTSPGHIDHADAQVFPPGTSMLARTGGANPTWNLATETCSSVYCHGGGTLTSDLALSVERSPTWNATTISAAECGSCHGIPPVDGSHTMAMTLADCHSCHSATIDATGELIVGATSTHMNGIVDVP